MVHGSVSNFRYKGAWEVSTGTKGISWMVLQTLANIVEFMETDQRGPGSRTR
jgi:hypothetical protein